MSRTESLKDWEDLQTEIISCRACPRLVEYRENVARERRRQFADFEYWGKPVPSFGMPDARLLIVGLAPAAHGGNRTGRMFTGDSSAKFLFKHLHLAGFAERSNSDFRGDGQKLVDCYITAAVRCAPPDNKPSKVEIHNCSAFLARELPMLPRLKVILTLGRLAFEATVDSEKRQHGLAGKFEFQHGSRYPLGPGRPMLVASFHPSPRNTQTGKLTSKMFLRVLTRVRKDLERGATGSSRVS